MKKIVPALVLAAFASPAFSQAPAAAAAPVIDVPKIDCPGKPSWPGRIASDGQKKLFDQQLKAYGDCVKAWLDQRQAAVRTAHATAKAHTDAANAVIAEYNEYLGKLKSEQGN